MDGWIDCLYLKCSLLEPGLGASCSHNSLARDVGGVLRTQERGQAGDVVRNAKSENKQQGDQEFEFQYEVNPEIAHQYC